MREMVAHAFLSYVLHWAILIFLLVLAFWLPKKWWQKNALAALAILIMVGPGYMNEMDMQSHIAKRKVARAIFDERCNTAEEKIYKTVEDVEGVLLLNIRKEPPDYLKGYNSNIPPDPYRPDAALPYSLTGKAYITELLNNELQVPSRIKGEAPRRGRLGNFQNRSPESGYITRLGYSYVDVKEDNGIVRYRFGKNELQQEHSPQNIARYAISYHNINEPEDRKHWVSGVTVTITDTQTQETLAEKTWYSFSPYGAIRINPSNPEHKKLLNTFCPQIDPSNAYTNQRGTIIRMFVDRVLIPKQTY